MSNFSPPRSGSPSRKCLHAVDRSPNYSLKDAASHCEHFRGISRPGSAAEYVEKKSLLFSSFTPSNVFPVVAGRGPIFPVHGVMARQVDREKRSEKVLSESPKRERQHEELAKMLSEIRAANPSEFMKQPPVLPAMRSTSPMLEVAAPGITRAMAYEPRGTSLVSIGGVVQPFIRPASAAAGSLALIVQPRPAPVDAKDPPGLQLPDEFSWSCSSMPMGSAVDASARQVAAATAAAVADVPPPSTTSAPSPASASEPSQEKVAPLQTVSGATVSRPVSSSRSGGTSRRCADAPEDAYKINVLLRSRPASGTTRPTPAEHYPLRSIVL